MWLSNLSSHSTQLHSGSTFHQRKQLFNCSHSNGPKSSKRSSSSVFTCFKGENVIPYIPWERCRQTQLQAHAQFSNRNCVACASSTSTMAMVKVDDCNILVCKGYKCTKNQAPNYMLLQNQVISSNNYQQQLSGTLEIAATIFTWKSQLIQQAQAHTTNSLYSGSYISRITSFTAYEKHSQTFQLNFHANS